MPASRPGDPSPEGDGGEFGEDAFALDDLGSWDDAGGDGQVQGLWLTASAPLPPGLLSAVATGGKVGAAGFGQGGLLDELSPGPVLANFAAEAAGGIAGTGIVLPGSEPAPGPSGTDGSPGSRLGQLSDEELTGLIRGYRKQASWAQAGELAAVAELAGRRRAGAQAAGMRDGPATEAATEEIAAALTLTGRAAQLLTGRAAGISRLPRTFAALATGHIDTPKALILLTGLAGQEPELAHLIETQILDRAPAQTTAQLRAALNRALLAAGPAAAEKRRQREEKYARIEQIPEPGSVTATLTGRYLPVTATLTAWNRISDLARQLKKAGASGHLDELRVKAYLALLTGQTISITDTPTTANPGPADAGTPRDAETAADAGTPGDAETAADAGTPRDGSGAADSGTAPDSGTPADSGASADAGTGAWADNGASAEPAPAGLRGLTEPARLNGTVNVTVPLATLLGITDAPGEVGAFGPITAYTARQIATQAMDAPAVRWCVTVVDENGVSVGHGCAPPVRGRRRKNKPADAAPGDWAITVKLRALAAADCSHERESDHYRPPPSLWHLIQTRNQRCTAAGCRMPAVRCDDDHTIPYEKGGRTCECNLGPLCRHHHRIKQLQGWRLEQPEPGIFAWVTPAGWSYITGPESYAT